MMTRHPLFPLLLTVLMLALTPLAGLAGVIHPALERQMTEKSSPEPLQVLVVMKDREGKERKTKMKYSLEGKKSKNKTNFGDQESTQKWFEQGQVLEISSLMHMKRGEMEFDVESVQTWKMEEGRLVIMTVRYTPMGEMETLAVYDRAGDE